MPIVSALLGSLTFALSSSLTHTPLSISENVLIMSVATATGCMPVTASLTGFIPALEYIVSDANGNMVYFSLWQLFLWSTGLCFFGIVFAALMHKRLVENDKLPWPGAKAVSQMLLTIHSKPTPMDPSPDHSRSQTHNSTDTTENSQMFSTARFEIQWQAKIIAFSGLASGSMVHLTSPVQSASRNSKLMIYRRSSCIFGQS